MYDFPDVASACAMIDRMMKTAAGTWRGFMEAVRQEADHRQTQELLAPRSVSR
ncbi:hypothetical protein [Micromonospora sp. NPDC004551]|uniref:hypothetical protein n=1 Tax=Micromonospora sp. NPDC004551 TaxID=3154284 RepID=UPI0033A49EF5